MLPQMKNPTFVNNRMSLPWLDSELRISQENNNITKYYDEAIQESIFFPEEQTVSISQEVCILAFSIMLKNCLVPNGGCSVPKINSVNFVFNLPV